MTSQPQDATLTILFSDIVDSTSGVLSRPDGERQMQKYYRWLDELVDAHAGANAKWIGDGIMAGFAFDGGSDRVGREQLGEACGESGWVGRRV